MLLRDAIRIVMEKGKLMLGLCIGLYFMLLQSVHVCRNLVAAEFHGNDV